MTDITNKETAELLKRYVAGIENYEADKENISNLIKDIYAEAKNKGFDVKTIRKLVKIKKSDKAKLQEEKYLLETYAEAIQLELF
jgi:uncharacterized protein (UPF0335 family)